jgi:hypothetical protein
MISSPPAVHLSKLYIITLKSSFQSLLFIEKIHERPSVKPRGISTHYDTGYKTMAAAELVFEGQMFQIPRPSLVATCELFLEKPNLLSTPHQVRSQVSETSF